MAKVVLSNIKRVKAVVPIRSTSPMIQHKWSEKAKQMMRDKQQKGTKTKARDKRDPESEAIEATYVNDDGDVGLPAMAFKSAIITAAHKDIGIEKTLVRKALFLRCNDANMVVAFDEASEPVVREDMVRVGAGSADLRWRPEFREWSCEITVILDADNLPIEHLINLVNRAGFGVGLCEMRPEKGKDFGRFEVDTTKTVTGG